MRWSCVFLVLSACGAPPRDFTDEQVVGILAAIEQGIIQTAEAAVPRLSDPGAATALIAEHRMATSLLGEMQLSGTASALALEAASEAFLMRARADPDATFETLERALHRQALALVDCVLLPTLVEDGLEALVKNTFRPLYAGNFTTQRPLQCFRVCLKKQSEGGELEERVRIVTCEY